MCSSPSLLEREETGVARVEDGTSPGRRVGRRPATISREINANGGRCRYWPTMAHDRASPTLRRSGLVVSSRLGRCATG